MNSFEEIIVSNKQKIKSACKRIVLQTILVLSCFLLQDLSFAQGPEDALPWHGIRRELRYRPEGNDIMIENGKKRFNRALYGGNTAFRAEAGDLPEFALYMPGMGGNLQFGILAGTQSKWLIHAAHIKAIYRPGSMLYEIRDPLLKGGIIYLTAIALYKTEALVVQVRSKNLPAGIRLIVVYGGATGKKFSRDGDIGADPESSFYLKPEYCTDNIYQVGKNDFSLLYGFAGALTEEERYEIQHVPVGEQKDNKHAATAKKIAGIFPPGMTLQLADANTLQLPATIVPVSRSATPVVRAAGMMKNNEELYFYIGRQEEEPVIPYSSVSKFFAEAEQQRKQLAERIFIHTPDPYINTLGGVLSIAADAIWESPSYLHGAVAWRMRLNGWRGAYAGDVLGWHDRARQHFDAYAASQLIAPPVTGVVMDTALHLARHLEKIGTALFSSGYISRNPNDSTRAHHYDMNLVFIDQLLNHFNWIGDTNYIRTMWPVITRHLAWEKRNFDADGDGLYDAYAAIWASDALQYNGGGVTHSSAYNYRANKMAAQLAALIGENPAPYREEADKIKAAVNRALWLQRDGWYAEYKDLLGKKPVHPNAALWTVYHAIDEGISDPFQSYLSLCYVDHHLPHIPMQAKGLQEKDLYLLSTTNWQPYTWSLNNVVMAENLHTALAYWQGNRPDDAFRLWKSSLVESMYLGSSPGNIQQLSFYDAIRGELYRDFADPIGMTARSLVEGLFGIHPDALQDTLVIQPGFPTAWNNASLHTPDINFDFKRNKDVDTYIIHQLPAKKLHLRLIVPVRKDGIAKIMVNNIPVKWAGINDAVGQPLLEVQAGKSVRYKIEIYWKGKEISKQNNVHEIVYGQPVVISFDNTLSEVFDPSQVLKNIVAGKNKLEASLYDDRLGPQTIFVRLRQGIAEWWQPVSLRIRPYLPKLNFSHVITGNFSHAVFETIPLESYFNDKVTNIFKHQYLSPRPVSPTLQLPTQGIGNWAYSLIAPVINDSGLRRQAAVNNKILTSGQLPFATPSDSSQNNILFTSQWDNFPDSVTIPLSGTASQLFLLLAGTTNAMQSRITNGMVIVSYTDGTGDTLLLKNPENWWPIEQDYYVDGFAFTTGDEMPERLYFKEGRFSRGLPTYETIRGFTNRAIDGGAATVLDMYLDKTKALRLLTVHAIANEVVIGLMAATLVR